jgi:hypothetical protein
MSCIPMGLQKWMGVKSMSFTYLMERQNLRCDTSMRKQRDQEAKEDREEGEWTT